MSARSAWLLIRSAKSLLTNGYYVASNGHRLAPAWVDLDEGGVVKIAPEQQDALDALRELEVAETGREQ